AAVADVNGDGALDVAVATGEGQVAVLVGGAGGQLTSSAHYDTGMTAAFSVAAANLNGDPHTDLVLSGARVSDAGMLSGFVSVLLGGDAGLAPATVYPALSGSTGEVLVADVDGDGISDIAVATSSSPGLSTFHGRGDGAFDAARTFPAGGYAYSL